MKVSIIGLGYIGLPTGALIASKGINVLGIDCILVIIGSIVPLFSSQAIWSYILLCFLSGIIWMSSTLLAIIMVNMYKYLITGSPEGSVWKKKRRRS